MLRSCPVTLSVINVQGSINDTLQQATFVLISLRFILTLKWHITISSILMLETNTFCLLPTLYWVELELKKPPPLFSEYGLCCQAQADKGYEASKA